MQEEKDAIFTRGHHSGLRRRLCGFRHLQGRQSGGEGQGDGQRLQPLQERQDPRQSQLKTRQGERDWRSLQGDLIYLYFCTLIRTPFPSRPWSAYSTAKGRPTPSAALMRTTSFNVHSCGINRVTMNELACALRNLLATIG